MNLDPSDPWRVIKLEDWAEIRRLHRAEQVPIKEIARRLGIARNTVRAALAAEGPPRYLRAAKGSIVDVVEPQIRALLREYPTMPATVIAERIGWTRSITVLKDRVRAIRPEYRGVDPVDKLAHAPGDTMQCDLWFPEPRIPLGGGQAAMLPVLVMTLAYSRFISARMIPSRSGPDLLAGMWALIAGLGAVTKRLWWDRESAIGGSGTLSAAAAAFAGTLATTIVLAPPRDPEFKGMVERHNGYLETSFLPGRSFTGPADFNSQLADWLPRANQRLVRSLAPATGSGAGGRPVEHLATDLAAMTSLPPVAPTVGWRHRVRLGREYYIRLDTCDYSVDPSVIGRFVDVHADLERVRVSCAGRLVADHPRSWARRSVVTDPAHVTAAAGLRTAWKHEQAARAAVRRHGDGHQVALRALPDYDALFGVEFTAAPTAATAATGQAR
jgi:transposase